MLPVAVCFGEVFTFEKFGIEGFLDRSDLHTPKYMSINLFAGERGSERARSLFSLFMLVVADRSISLFLRTRYCTSW